MEVYFKDKRFRLNPAGDFLARLVVICAYIVLAVATVVFLMAPQTKLFFVGLLLALFLLDRAYHAKKGERTLFELQRQNRANLALALTPTASRALAYARRRSTVTNQDFHLVLLWVLLERRDVRETLKRLEADIGDLKGKLEGLLSQGNGETDLQATVADFVLRAYQVAVDSNESYIECRSLFGALFSVADPRVRSLFDAANISTEDASTAVIFGRFRRRFSRLRSVPATIGGFVYASRFLRHRTMNRAWTARPTPNLDQFGIDLTDLARREKIGLLIGHEKEFNGLLDVVARPGKPNALLVGEPGSGKSTLIAHLAFRMIKDDVPPVLFDKRLVSLDVAGLLAGAAAEVLAGRLRLIAEEIVTAGNVVLFLPNVHDWFKTADKGGLNAIDLILPVIRDAGIPVVAETYPREFKAYVEPRTDFLEQFDVVRVDEIAEEDAVRVLIYESLLLEKANRTFITFGAVKAAVDLAHRYFSQKLLPGSATDLLKQTIAALADMRRKAVTGSDVTALAEKLSRIPIQRAGQVEARELLGLETTIHKKLIDQEAAVSAVSRALREYRAGLKRKGGPIASFLFVGPTGVGKTELAKILAEVQFGDRGALSRFDMTEFQEKSSLERFIGAPDGSRPGVLTDAVREKPYQLVLLDEFEKASPDILNLFLQVFDDGRLTDSLGRTVDFTNTIIIATSNANSDYIKSEIEKGKKVAEIADEIKDKLTSVFKPELLNRFSDIIVFRELTPSELALVAGLMMQELAEALKESNGMTLVFDEASLKGLVQIGWSPVFGARPLRGAIEEKVRSVLAEKILREEVKRGDRIQLSFQNGEFKFS
ncbi:ATP-dependent Clp protease ATP-binding subunit [Patescibacteria group bacterium]|nr:ATP-dependent Clp protease ATP-binding subunit [Patescibacteria group bacterium]